MCRRFDLGVPVQSHAVSAGGCLRSVSIPQTVHPAAPDLMNPHRRPSVPSTHAPSLLARCGRRCPSWTSCPRSPGSRRNTAHAVSTARGGTTPDTRQLSHGARRHAGSRLTLTEWHASRERPPREWPTPPSAESAGRSVCAIPAGPAARHVHRLAATGLLPLVVGLGISRLGRGQLPGHHRLLAGNKVVGPASHGAGRRYAPTPREPRQSKSVMGLMTCAVREPSESGPRKAARFGLTG